jgi:hypothetical protein
MIDEGEAATPSRTRVTGAPFISRANGLQR